MLRAAGLCSLVLLFQGICYLAVAASVWSDGPGYRSQAARPSGECSVRLTLKRA